MTRNEAFNAMVNGHKVSHRLFEEWEYLYIKGGQIYTEDGYGFMNFWEFEFFQEGWSVV